MIELQIKNEEVDLDLTIKIKNEWNELTMGEYLSMVDLITNKDKYEDEMFYIKFIEIISDASEADLLEIPVNDLTKFTEAFGAFSKMEVPKDQLLEHFEVDGQLYVVKKNMSNLTTSETIYIKTIQKNSTTLADMYIGLLSIIVRPGFSKEEDGKIRYFQHKLVDDDIEERRKFIKDKLPVTIGVPLVELFMPGTSE